MIFMVKIPSFLCLWLARPLLRIRCGCILWQISVSLILLLHPSHPKPNVATVILPGTFRSKKHLAMAHATEAVAPLLRLVSRAWTGSPTPPQTWRKGLLLGANHIGDILYRTSSLRQLAQGLPDCQWDILAPEPAAQVLECNPAIRKIHKFDLPTSPKSKKFKILQQEKYDVAICYDSGSYTSPLLTALLLGIPNRVGYIHKGWSGLVTHPISIPYPQPFPAYFRDLVGQLTGQKPTWDLRPEVLIDPQDEVEAAACFNKIEGLPSIPLIACFVTTRQPTGVWPLDKFRETLELLHSSASVRIILCGAPGDSSQLKSLQTSLSFPCSINAGRLGLRALVAFLKKCRAVLSTDSGPRHLANAAGVPVVYFRNLRSSKVETGNYLPSEYDLSPNAEFTLPDYQRKFLDKITPDAVTDRILQLMN